MSEFSSVNTWDWNCKGKNDLDYRAEWGIGGTVTIQRNFLRSITFKIIAWNEKDGQVELSSTKSYSPPTSETQTLQTVFQAIPFAKGIADEYWGVDYWIKGVFTIISGSPEAIDEETITTVQGVFIGGDANYNCEIFPECHPPAEPKM